MSAATIIRLKFFYGQFREMSFTPLPRLAIEALVIAVSFAIVIGIVHVISMQVFDDAMNHIALVSQAALSAALLHIGFEYTGLNEWYCKQRDKRVKS